MNNSGRIMRRGLMLAAATASVFALAACAGGGGGGAASTDGGGDGGKTDIKVQVAPIHYETAYIALQEGFFEEAGLNVEIVPGADAAANLAQAMSGDVDITTVSWGAVTTSVSTGMPISVIAGNGIVSDEIDTSGIVVKQDSPIQSVADLQGKNVAVNGVKSGGDIPMLQAVEAAGGDWTTVNEIGIPYSGMQTALEQGTVDAAFPADSFYQQAVEAGFRVIANPVREFQAGMPVTAWAASDAWVAENPGTATKFTEAMAKAVDFYMDSANAEVLAQIVADVKQISIEQARATVHAPMQVEVNVQRAQDLSDDYMEFGIITTPVSAEEILWSEAPRL